MSRREVSQARQHRPRRLTHLPRLHELRRARARRAPLDARRGREPLPLIKQAIDAGINFLDTANVYSDGTSEEIVGKALAANGSRDELVVATKVHGPMRKGAERLGPLTQGDHEELDHSLRRLGTDYVDLYQIHRWDFRHADRRDDGGAARRREGRQGALHRRLVDGRMAVLEGAVHRPSERLDALRLDAEPLQPAVPRGGARDDSTVRRPGRGAHPVEPAGRGRLARDWDETTARTETDEFGKTLYHRQRRNIVDAVDDIAEARGIPRAQVALAWMLSKRYITSPIFGATKASQIDDAVAATELTLTADEIADLEAPYAPHAVAGHQTSWSMIRSGRT